MKNLCCFREHKMSIQLAEHLVYVKDSEWSTLQIGEVIINNSIVKVFPEFPAVDNVLTEIKHFASRKDDIWLLDFPKSGTNWMVAILNLLTKKKLTSIFRRKVEGMLEIGPNLNHWESLLSPRVLNTYIRLPLLPDNLFDNNKVIVMMRNPKSVAVSLYYHLKGLGFYEYNGTFNGFLPQFMEGHLPDLFGNWFDYTLEVWEAFKNKPNVLFVFYEELKKDPVKIIINFKIIGQVSDFIELEHDEDLIKGVAQTTAMDNLKRTQQELETENPNAVNVIFRKGTITDWKNHFTEAQNEMFDAVYEDKMKNYPDLKERIQFC